MSTIVSVNNQSSNQLLSPSIIIRINTCLRQ